MSSILRNDILNPALAVPVERILITPRWEEIIATSMVERQRTPYPAKTLNEFFELVRQAILHQELREGTIEQYKIFYTEEDPDFTKSDQITIVFSLKKQEPGQMSKGGPFTKGDTVRNQVPMLREEVEDTENPGYKRAILGYYYDNEVVFTVFAKTNKVANQKVIWFQKIMQEYQWFFTAQGVNRVLFSSRGADFAIEKDGAKMYGRPVHYFVRTEELVSVSQKKLEEISVGVSAHEEKI